MSLFFPARVLETTTTEGTGDIVLAGATSGYAPLSRYFSDGDLGVFIVIQGTTFEEFLGQYNSGGSITRIESYLNSSGVAAAIDWGSGTKDVYATFRDEYFIRRNAAASTSYVLDDALEHRDSRESPTNTVKFSWSSDIWQISLNDTLYGSIDAGEGEWNFPKPVTGVEGDFVTLKHNGQTLGTAALKDTGTTLSKLVVLNSDGKFDRARIYEMTGATDADNGASGMVPQPDAGEEGKFLRGDGTWANSVQTFTGSWESSLSSAGLYGQNHGLGTRPFDYWWEFECTSADAGFAVSNSISLHTHGAATNEGVSIYASNTSINMRIGSGGVQVPNRSTGALTGLDLTKWRARPKGVIY